jgi:hypothetical protein
VLVLALCAHAWRARDAALAVRLAWATGLGAAVGALWLTREEGPWILPRSRSPRSCCSRCGVRGRSRRASSAATLR